MTSKVCPNCGHVDSGYGQEDGYVICSECDCGDPTNMIGPHIAPGTRTCRTCGESESANPAFRGLHRYGGTDHDFTPDGVA